MQESTNTLVATPAPRRWLAGACAALKGLREGPATPQDRTPLQIRVQDMVFD